MAVLQYSGSLLEPARGVCTALGLMPAGATCLWGEDMPMHDVSVRHEQERQSECFFVPLELYILGLEKARSCFKMTKQLPKFLWSFDRCTLPGETDGPLWSSTSPSAPQQSCSRVRKGGELIPWWSNAVIPCGVKLQLPG